MAMGKRPTAEKPEEPPSKIDLALKFVRTALRALQLLLALVVAGLYGGDLNRASKAGQDGPSEWIYATVVAGLSAVTALVFMIPFVKSHYAFSWDTVLFFLWVAVFGILGKKYLGVDPLDDATQRMRNAVWVDLSSMVLWLTTASMGAFVWFKRRNAKKAPPTTLP